jgi:exodeoxyribonuclease VII small subunit
MPDQIEPSFEAAVSQLEKIIETLERGEPDLATALAHYESGVRLLNQCYGLLERADRAVALLTGVDEEASPITVPFDASATDQTEKPASKTARASRLKKAALAPELEAETDPLDPPF